MPPLPPGCMQTMWGDDERFVDTYFTSIPGRQVYSTFDWGIRDEDGYYFILGRTDDVINVAGHRLGTREIEESISQPSGRRRGAPVVGVADQLKGQVAAGLRGAQGSVGDRGAGRTPGARGRGAGHGRPPSWARVARLGPGPLHLDAAQEPARARCCAVRSRRCARAGTPAT
jgi:hypothetical protein